MVQPASILGPAMFQWDAAVGAHPGHRGDWQRRAGECGRHAPFRCFLLLIGFALLWFKRSVDSSRHPEGVVTSLEGG